jgi:AcrR family transcriptional regulator
MPAENRDMEDPQWREVILNAARRCLSVKGFHDVTLDDVCRMSMLRRSALYRYFPNKDALLGETVRWGTRGPLAVVSSVGSDSGESEGAVQRLMESMTPILEAPTFFDVGRFNIEWWAWAARNEVGLSAFRETWQEWREQLTSLIRTEVGPEAADETVLAMANLMLAIFNGLMLHMTLEAEELDLEEITRLQQLGWDGIFERVRAETGGGGENGADGEQSAQSEPGRAKARRKR